MPVLSSSFRLSKRVKPVASGLEPCCCCGICGKQVPLRLQCQVTRAQRSHFYSHAGRESLPYPSAEVYGCAFITCICLQLSRRVDSAVKLAKLVKQTLNTKGLFEGGCLLCSLAEPVRDLIIRFCQHCSR